MDMSGKVIFQQQLTITEGDHTYPVALQQGGCGTYFVRMEFGEQYHYSKMVIH